MIKTVKINKEQELTLSNNLAWATIYKDQFGHDIIPDIMPLMSAAIRLIKEMAAYTDMNEIVKNTDFETIQETLIELCAFQFTDVLNLYGHSTKPMTRTSTLLRSG